jgi:serine/threonine protein kinase
MNDPAKPLSSPEGLRLFRALAQALDHAHSKGVLHRDLKPQNVRIDEQGRTQLGDFGIERALTPASTIIGSPAYMAPELISKEPTAASDRYAFAVMVYQWLCKQLPFDGEDTAKVLMKHLKEPPPPRPMAALPPRVQAAIVKGLAKDPKDRWPSAFAMVQEISDALLGQMAAALLQNMPTTTLTAEKIQPMRWMIRVAMVAVMVLAVVVGMWAMSSMGSSPAVGGTTTSGRPSSSDSP